MINRWIENGLLEALEETGMGCIVFSPLAQGMLTDRYLERIPEDSRAGKPGTFLKPEQVTQEKLNKVRALSEVAKARGQSMAQLAIAWVLRHKVVTSALIGASKPQQILDVAGAINNLDFSSEELNQIETILAS